MTHKICSLVWLISILVVSPLFFFTDIEYKDPEDHSIAACIYTFPDIIVEDAISEDDLKTEILTNVKQPSFGIIISEIYFTVVGSLKKLLITGLN